MECGLAGTREHVSDTNDLINSVRSNCGRELIEMDHIAAHHFNLRGGRTEVPWIDIGIHAHDILPGRDQLPHQAGANEASTADHQDRHLILESNQAGGRRHSPRTQLRLPPTSFA